MAKKDLLPVTPAIVPQIRNGIFVGVDQSLTDTGLVALNQAGEYIDHASIETSPSRRPMGEIERLLSIWKSVHEFVADHAGEHEVGICQEDFAYSQAQKMADLGGLGWLLRIMFSRTPWNFCVAPIASLKRTATGKGVANKAAIILNVYKRWGFETTNDNVADAYVLARIAWAHYSRPLPRTGGTRKSDFDALKKIKTYR